MFDRILRPVRSPNDVTLQRDIVLKIYDKKKILHHNKIRYIVTLSYCAIVPYVFYHSL